MIPRFRTALTLLAAGVLASGGPAPLFAQAAEGMQFALGDEHSCALAQGRAICWGRDTEGELGRGASVGRQATPEPRPVAAEMSFVSISAGSRHTCAVAADGALWCWGQGARGQLGDGQARSSGAPVRVASEEPFAAVAAGSLHTCALSRAGEVFCWGDAEKGRLGTGTVTTRCRRAPCAPGPVRVPLPELATALAAGQEFTCALTAGGAAFCWGSGRAGQLGNGGTEDRAGPVPVAGAARFVQVTAGREHACGTTAEGFAHCWGGNERGQVGGGDSASGRVQPVPRPVAGGLRWTRLAARDDHTCGLTSTGRLYCWGASDDELFGLQPVRSREREPVAVTDAQFVSFALGRGHACGLGRDGTAYCWGSNNRGQLGFARRERDSAAARAAALPLRTLPELAAAERDPALRNGAVAANGLRSYESNLRSLLASPDAEAAEIRLALRRRGAPDDELLGALYRATIGHYTGEGTESDGDLHRAGEIIEARYTASASRGALAMLTSDQALAFMPSRTERRMIHYFAALNRLRAGDTSGAVVEARRLADLMQREDEAEKEAPAPAERRARAFLRYFTGTVFEAAGERGDADVAYRNARALAGDSLIPRAAAGARGTGEVVVLVEWGFVPHRVEQELLIPLSVEELTELKSDSTSETVARSVSDRVVALFGAEPNDGLVYYRTRPPSSFSGGRGGESLRTVKLAWPVLFLEDPATPRMTLLAPGGEVPVRMTASLADGLVADFARERPAMLARMVARAAVKLAAVEGAEAEVTERGGALLGSLAGILANTAANATERADTRSWYLLPGSLGLARVRLPAGRHTLRLRMAGGEAPVVLGTVEVRAGGVSFLATRLLDRQGTRMGGPAAPAARP